MDVQLRLTAQMTVRGRLAPDERIELHTGDGGIVSFTLGPYASRVAAQLASHLLAAARRQDNAEPDPLDST